MVWEESEDNNPCDNEYNYIIDLYDRARTTNYDGTPRSQAARISGDQLYALLFDKVMSFPPTNFNIIHLDSSHPLIEVWSGDADFIERTLNEEFEDEGEYGIDLFVLQGMEPVELKISKSYEIAVKFINPIKPRPFFHYVH